MSIDLQRLIQFYQVAETKSVVRAAERLKVDQAWLLRQIKQLETQLGFLLFDRIERQFALTPEGEAFFAPVKELAERSKRVLSVVRSLGSGGRREIYLGTVDSAFWIPEREQLLAAIASDHPDIGLNLVVRTSTELMACLQEREIDICVVGMGHDMDRFDHMTIHQNRPQLLLPREHPLAEKPALTMSDVDRLDLAVPTIDNDYSFEHIYGPFLHAGAIPHWAPEGPLPALHLAVAHRICAVAWGFEASVNSSMVCREVVGCDAKLEVVIAKHHDDDREPIRQIWAIAMNIAHRVSAECGKEVNISGKLRASSTNETSSRT